MERKVKIDIEGMSCASCASNIEKSLKKVSGVKSASVNIMTNKGLIDIEDNVSEDQIRKAISDVGNYKATKIEFDSEDSTLDTSSLDETSKKKVEALDHNYSKEGHEHNKKVEDSEITLWKKKLIWVWLITIPITLIMFSERLLGFRLMEMQTMTIVLLILSFPVIF
ncbi:heavy metal translocating P-type ATPase, partial [Candidatus Woesearchaeota archaeon]|nr:heavy metal translocating P-type ATPase [Candidatus Woesearchaeota archaeon]